MNRFSEVAGHFLEAEIFGAMYLLKRNQSGLFQMECVSAREACADLLIQNGEITTALIQDHDIVIFDRYSDHLNASQDYKAIYHVELDKIAIVNESPTYSPHLAAPAPEHLLLYLNSMSQDDSLGETYTLVRDKTCHLHLETNPDLSEIEHLKPVPQKAPWDMIILDGGNSHGDSWISFYSRFSNEGVTFYETEGFPPEKLVQYWYPPLPIIA